MKNFKAIHLLVLFFLTFFPLYFHDYYFDITKTKYHVFLVLSILIFLCGIKCTTQKNLTDLIFLAFLCSCTFSCLLSEWRYFSFTGERGKYVGLIFLYSCGGLYFGITRCLSLKKVIYLSFPIVLILESFLSLTQFLGYDFLGFYDNMAAGTYVMYRATFGHVDVFSAFLCVYLPICLYYFCYSHGKEQLLFAFSCFCGFFGVFSANSDSAYIGLFVSLWSLSCLCTKSAKCTQNLGVLIGIYILSAKIFHLLASYYEDTMHPQSALTLWFTSTPILFGLCILSLVLLGYSSVCIAKKIRLFTKLPHILLGLGCSFLILLFCLFLWFSFKDTTTELGIFENYLRFNEHWGSDRGYVWKWLTQFFFGSSFLVWIFGAGPDTTSLLLSKYFHTEMTEQLGVYYASAHNEYLNYLVTVGIAGTLLYLALVISSVIRCMKNREHNIFFGAVGIAIISYSAMAVVNISQPITVPFLFLLIAFANIRQKN